MGKLQGAIKATPWIKQLKSGYNLQRLSQLLSGASSRRSSTQQVQNYPRLSHRGARRANVQFGVKMITE